MLAFDHASAARVLRHASIGSVSSTSIGALCWLVLPRLAPAILRRGPLARWGVLIGIICILADAGCLIASLILLAAEFERPADFWPDFQDSLKVSLVLTLIFGLGSFFTEVLAGELRHERTRAERLRQAATEARLSSLESRVHPHFLFNTLNSISSLIREDSALAERTVERLASLLRFSLETRSGGLVPL